MSAKDWLDSNEWENSDISSQTYPHYTKLDKVMEEYAKHYLKEKLKALSNSQKESKFL